MSARGRKALAASEETSGVRLAPGGARSGFVLRRGVEVVRILRPVLRRWLLAFPGLLDRRLLQRRGEISGTASQFLGQTLGRGVDVGEAAVLSPQGLDLRFQRVDLLLEVLVLLVQHAVLGAEGVMLARQGG